MKTGKKYILVMAVLTALAAGSCAKVEVEQATDSPRIVYNAVIAKKTSEGDTATKAVLEGVAYPTDMTFRSVAYYNNDKLLDNGVKDTRAAALDWIPESTVEYKNGYWMTDTEYLWPYGGYLSFLAYSPASLSTLIQGGRKMVTMDRDGITASWDSERDGMKGVDFMIADVKTNMIMNERNGGYIGVPTTFNHVLSAVKVSAKSEGNASGEFKIVIKSLRLKNVYTTGKFQAPFISGISGWGVLRPEWNDFGNAKKYIDLYNDPAGHTVRWDEFEQVGTSYIVIPQKLDSDPDRGEGQDSWVALEITHERYNRTGVDANGTSIYGTTPHMTETRTIRLDEIQDKEYWERGTIYHYKLSIGEHKLINFEGISENWGSPHDIELKPEIQK